MVIFCLGNGYFESSSRKQGTMSWPGGHSFTGPANFDQTVHAGGDITSDANIIDNGVNTNHHSH